MSGNLGDHALAVLSAREDLGLKGGIESDCAPLHGLVMSLEECGRYIKFMRDLTRGGLAGVVSEIIEDRAFGLQISESSIPLGEATRNACELLGLDALYLANEGKILLVVEGQHADKIVGLLKKHPLGCEARIVGEVVPGPPGRAYLVTTIGTRRVLEPPFDDQLPRIC